MSRALGCGNCGLGSAAIACADELRQEINVEQVTRKVRGRGVKAGKPIVIVGDVQHLVLGNHDAAGEEVRAEPRGLPAQLHGVEHATKIVPAERADQSLLAVAEFLPAKLERERKFLEIAEREAGLVQIQRVRLRAVAFAFHRAGHRRVVRVREAVVALRKTAAAFSQHAPPFVRVAGTKTDALQEILIADVRAVIAKIHRAGHARDCEPFLGFIAQAHGATEIPLVHPGIILAQGFVDEARERRGRRRRCVLGLSRSEDAKRQGGGGQRDGGAFHGGNDLREAAFKV